MDNHPFKSISMKQLEEAFAAAITAITTTETEVTVSMMKDVSFGADGFIGQQRYELAVSLTSAKLYPKSEPLPEGDVPIEF